MIDRILRACFLGGTCRCRVATTWFLSIVTTVGAVSAEPAPPTDPARALPLLLRSLAESHRLLYVTAHPDDEDAGLLVKLRHVDGVETALLTLTRGEGGQNEIGTELFHALGVLRSRELEAAGAYTGATQLFSRAYEFGYSFSVEETFEKWNREEILRDVVQVIRSFRPDVVLTMWPEGPGGGQHHQASAQIATDAFHAAATDRWPELGEPHQAARLFHQLGGEAPAGVHRRCDIPLGDYDPLLGASDEEMGLASRAQHKCQGMARLSDPYPRRVSRWQWAFPAGSEAVVLSDFFDGLPQVIDAVTPLRRRAETIAETLQPERPDLIVPDVLDLYGDIVDVLNRPSDPTTLARLLTLRLRAAEALRIASGLRVAARADARFVAAGGEVGVALTFENHGRSPLDVEVARDSLFVVGESRRRTVVVALKPGERRVVDVRVPIAKGSAPTIPVPVPAHASRLNGRADTAPHWRAFTFDVRFRIDGSRPVRPAPIPLRHEERREGLPGVFEADVHVVPDPSVWPVLERVAMPSPPGQPRTHAVEFHVSSIDGGDVDVRLTVPEGWRVEPPAVRLPTRAGGLATTTATFAVTAPEGAPPARLAAAARYAGAAPVSRHGVQIVDYPHIRPGALLNEAVVTAVPFSCAVPRDVRVAYVEGSGDRTREAMERLGLSVTPLTRSDLLEGALDGFDVIMTGVRVAKVREDFKAAFPRLRAWMEAGGTLITQYNKFEFNDGRTDASPFAPYPALVGNRRITVEEASVRVRHPDHPVFHRPNELGEDTWQGWVQERGLYFLDVADERYVDLVSMEDPWPKNAGVKGGALVTAPVGVGRWAYVGLGLFRQLPAAVPGAYRLLANLIALGGS